MGFYQFKQQQLINSDLDTLWDFISSPANLSKITPTYMGFEITNSPGDKMYPGAIVSYKVSPLLGIKMTWVTEITHVVDKKFFIDEQKIGPYKLWHHQHILEQRVDGVLMTDIVSYSPPFGFLGSIANELFIKKKLNQIFKYRNDTISGLFL